MMGTMFDVMGWASPVGVGIFLVCLGLFIYLLSLTGKNRRDK